MSPAPHVGRRRHELLFVQSQDPVASSYAPTGLPVHLTRRTTVAISRTAPVRTRLPSAPTDVTGELGIHTDVPSDFVQRVEDALVVDPLSIPPVEDPEDEDDPSEEGP